MSSHYVLIGSYAIPVTALRLRHPGYTIAVTPLRLRHPGNTIAVTGYGLDQWRERGRTPLLQRHFFAETVTDPRGGRPQKGNR